MSVSTLDLRAGMRVVVSDGIVRTVASVTDSGYVNSKNAPLWTVIYTEGRTDGWSEGNTASGAYAWTVMCDCGHVDEDHFYSHTQASLSCQACTAWCDL